MRTLLARDYKDPKCVKVREATKQGYAEARPGDSINLEQPNSKTRRGRVGKEVAQTLTTSCNQAAVVDASICQVGQIYPNSGNPQSGRVYNPKGLSPALDSCQGGNRMPKVVDEWDDEDLEEFLNE